MRTTVLSLFVALLLSAFASAVLLSTHAARSFAQLSQSGLPTPELPRCREPPDTREAYGQTRHAWCICLMQQRSRMAGNELCGYNTALRRASARR
jgi:hypothetical protein